MVAASCFVDLSVKLHSKRIKPRDNEIFYQKESDSEIGFFNQFNDD
jgi:hypothetical protein